MRPQILSGTELNKYGKMSKGKMRIQLVANQNVVFKFLKDNKGIRLLFVGTRCADEQWQVCSCPTHVSPA